MNRKKLQSLMLPVLSLIMLLGAIPAPARAEQIKTHQAEDFFSPGREQEENRIHILLVGQDQREGEAGNRSDSMILCTISPKTKTVMLTSFLRDLYVTIPGHGKNRINAAYSWGGVELLEKTLEENFGIEVDGNIQVDFEQFSKIIDSLGGVNIEIREDEARQINRAVPWKTASAGKQTLSGDQALAYVRIRNLDADGDFSRTERQRKLLLAIAGDYQNMTMPAMMDLLKKLLPCVTTDLSYFQILTFGGILLPVMKDLKLQSQQIPQKTACRDQMVEGMAVLVPDLPKARSFLQDSFDQIEKNHS